MAENKAKRATVTEGAKRTTTRKSLHTIYDDGTTGQVQVADDVIATIVALAATEVDGVASVGGGITREKVTRTGSRALAKAVKVDVLEKVISVRAILNMRYGYNIPDTCKKVQEKIKAAIEEMTGLEVADVAVSVADVTVEKTKSRDKEKSRKK